jgi:hypothetical protein
MVIALVALIALIVYIIINIIGIFTSETMAPYRYTIKGLIGLLFQKGYCLEQVKNILKFYD